MGLDFFLFEKAEKAFRSVDGEAVIAELQKVGVGGGEAARKDQRFRHENSPFSLDEDED